MHGLSVIIVNYLFYVLGHILCTSYIATYVVLAVMQNFHEQKKIAFVGRENVKNIQLAT